jgi:hypothetical protein
VLFDLQVIFVERGFEQEERGDASRHVTNFVDFDSRGILPLARAGASNFGACAGPRWSHTSKTSRPTRRPAKSA